MSQNSETYFWKKKEFLSFVLSILVFFIHSYFAQDYTSGNLVSIINHKTSFFFSQSITQFAVPMFFMLSGISFFKGYSNNQYSRKMKSRFFSLVIPYLLWNTVWMLWGIITTYISESSVNISVTSVLKGIFFYGYYPPFWFMFNLIVFSFAAPLVFLIVKNKYVSLSVIVCLSILSAFGIHLPQNLFYYPNSIIFYLIGATVGYHYFDFVCKKSSKTTQVVSVTFLFAYILAKNIIPQELYIDNYLTEVIIFTLCAFALWNTADIFIEKINPRAIYRRSFAVYAMHLNIALVVLKVLSALLPQSELTEIPKFVIMIVLTLLIINLVCIFLERFLPKIYALFFGSRIIRATLR